jgi:hypothetical protein
LYRTNISQVTEFSETPARKKNTKETIYAKNRKKTRPDTAYCKMWKARASEYAEYIRCFPGAIRRFASQISYRSLFGIHTRSDRCFETKAACFGDFAKTVVLEKPKQLFWAPPIGTGRNATYADL